MGPPTHPTLHTYRILLDIQTSRQSTLFQCLSTVVRWWAIFGPLLLGARGEAMSRKLWQNFRIKSFAFQTALFGNHHSHKRWGFLSNSWAGEHTYQVCTLVSTRTKYVPLCARFHKGWKIWEQNSEQDRFLYTKDNPHQNSSLVLLFGKFWRGELSCIQISNVPEKQGIYKNGPSWGNVLTFPSSDISPAIWWSLLYVKPQEVVLDLGRSAGQWCIMECILLTLTGPLGGPRSLRPGIRQPSDG